VLRAPRPDRFAGDVARAEVARGLLELGIITALEDAPRFTLHHTSHKIGLAVHDPMPERTLAPGMVITVEPGVYLPDEGLGIRIDDDVLVTEDGYEVLSAAAPKEIDAIEAWMATRGF